MTRAAWMCPILLAACGTGWAAPGPGDVFREYPWNGPWVNAGNWQRVTDPQARHSGAKAFLPNPVNRIAITDLADAIRAEVCIEQWGGHAGTSEKRLRVNGGPWIPIPESAHMGPKPPEAYQYFRYPCVAVPLEQIKAGENTFEFTCGKQVAHDFGWGQWGIYGVTFRIYYGPGKPHPTGEITSPRPGAAVGDSAVLAASASSAAAPIRQVDFIGLYEDFNYEGDGLYRQWHYTYRYGRIRHHLGTATRAPYSVAWDTAWVPDQGEPVRIMARIVDTSGLCCMTAAVHDVRLERAGRSVRLYKPQEVPSGWQTRAGRTHRCRVDVGDDLGRAVAARMILATWSGGHADEIGVNDAKVVKSVGKAHDYSYDEVDVPLGLLRPGANTFYTKAATEHHGIEVMWPGIALKVQYDLAPSGK